MPLGEDNNSMYTYLFNKLPTSTTSLITGEVAGKSFFEWLVVDQSHSLTPILAAFRPEQT
jgi:2-keto-3-deoxy-L-rhamnonate aldolase RhmA